MPFQSLSWVRFSHLRNLELREGWKGDARQARKHASEWPGNKTLSRLKYNLHYAIYIDNLLAVPGKSKSKHRSGCPVSISLETFGDRWSLLIIRDLMVRAYRTFREFQQSGEGIATNILAHRLKNLRAAGIITTERDESDGRKLNYRLTEKGIDLAPVLLELLIWGARHEQTGVPCEVIENMAKNRDAVLAEVRRRWQVRDPRPFLPKFGGGVQNDG